MRRADPFCPPSWSHGVSRAALLIGMRAYLPDIAKERWYAFQGAGK